MTRRAKVVWSVTLGGVLVATIVAVGLNFAVIRDYIAGANYEPSSEMIGIRSGLGLTEKGRRIFNATHPELNEREDFNENCRMAEEEGAILGCYKDDRIYVYDITLEELDGIRELTAAHELLHAVWARMSDGEKEGWRSVLEAMYVDNTDTMGEEIELYDENEKLEEKYVRAGTEVQKLPERLEEHFAEIFENQDAVVAYYNKYNAAFKAVEARVEELGNKLETMKRELDERTEKYMQDLARFNAEVEEFNECANTVGCFTTETRFYARRGVLVAEQKRLETEYDEISKVMDDYNAMVEEYNDNVIHGRELNNAINSASRPGEVE